MFGTIGGLLIANDNAAAGGILIAVGFLPAFFCFPLATSHLAMPIQWPGWLSPKILGQYFQGMVKPAMYWCMFCAATMLPSLICILIIVFGFGDDLSKIVEDLNHNARVENIMSYEEPKKKNAPAPAEQQQEAAGQITTELNPVTWWFFASKDQILSEKKYYEAQSGGASGLPSPSGTDTKKPWEREIDMEPVIVPAVLWFVALIPFAFAAVFNMKTNALFTYYFQPELQLIREEKEVKWEGKKSGELDDEGRELEGANMGKAAAGIGGTIVFYIVANVVMYFVTGGEYLLLPRPIAKALNLVNQQQSESQ